MISTKTDKLLLSGAGGGKKPKKQLPPVEAPNTLRSVAKGRVLDLIAYGPIKGPVDGMKSIFLDDTPLQNADDSYNFDGIDVEFRHGDPSQDVIPGFIDVSNPREINAEIRFTSPIVRTLLNNDADAVNVTLRIPALVKTNVENGDTNPAELPFKVEVLNGAGQTVKAIQDTIRGKNMAPYEVTYRLDFEGVGPFSVKVSRTNAESETSELQDKLFWSYLTEVIDIRQSYPNCAMFGISIDARLFGNSIPSRKYLVDLSIIKVPSNYDPMTKTYTGFWDGTFKEAWTDNPAWCFYDLATHPIIGAGITEVNKWALYEIGKYCDELVDDGYGGKESRFTCNTIFSSAEEAITALNTLASVFRGMAYWGSNSIEPVADMPGPIRKIITPAEVIDGAFTYEGTSLKERHSVAIVMWNDPEDGYTAKPEMVEDATAIELLGWREVQVTAVACSSRGQARRLGLWILYSEREETQMVNFSVTSKHSDFRPGEFFEVQDPYRAGARLSGKISKVTGSTLVLDTAPVELTPGWDITVELANGGLQRVKVSSVTGSKITVTPALGVVNVGAAFILSSVAVRPQVFRVSAVREGENSIFSVTATEHDPRKYDIVEKGLTLPDVPTSLLPSGQLGAPRNLTATSYKYPEGGTEHQGLTVGWTASEDPRTSAYMLDVKGPNDVAFRTVYVGEGLSYDLPLVVAGIWKLRVRATSPEWGNSAWTETSVDLDNLLAPMPPTSLTFTSTVNTITVKPIFTGFNRQFEFWRSNVALTLDLIESNAVFLGEGTFFVDSKLTYATTYYYYVRGTNLYGKSSWVAGQATTSADVDDILDLILDEQQETPLGQWFQGEIDKISGDGEGSLTERIGGVDQRLTAALDQIRTGADTIQSEIDQLQLQVAEFALAEEWDPLVDYPAGSLVKWQGSLYRANQPVEGFHVYDELYWAKVGDFDSLTGAISDLALRVQQAEFKVSEVNGLVTPMATELNALSAMWREQDAEGYLAGAIEAWYARADITEETRVRANAVESLAERITLVTTSLGSVSSSVSLLETSFSTMTNSFAQQLAQLRADMGGEINAAINSERLVTVSREEALAQQITELDTKLSDDIQSSVIEETSARVAADEAFALQLSSMNSKVEGNLARIIAEEIARATADDATAQSINTLVAETSTKARVFKQSSPPSLVGRSHGDLWINIADNNAIYFFNGTGWELSADSRILTNTAAIQEEKLARTDQFGALATQQSTTQAMVALKNRTFRQSNAPSSTSGYTLVPGDIWVRNLSTGNITYRWSGTHWEETTDYRVISSAASVQQLQTATATTDGKLNAMWGVKLELNQNNQSVIAGVGLGINNHDGVIKSNFLVKADTFAVMNGLAGAETIPFAVQNGKVIIRDAMIGTAAIKTANIENAAITNAKIGTLAVDTLNLRGNAVTVPSAITYGSRPLEAGNVAIIGPIYVPAIDLKHVLVSATANVLAKYGDPAINTFALTTYFQIPSETMISNAEISISAMQSSSLTSTGTGAVPEGLTGSIPVYARIQLTGVRAIGFCTLSVTGIKK